MKKLIFVCILAILSFALTAQLPELSIWNNIRNSSYTIDDSIHIRCETIDLPGINTELFYFDGSQWLSKPMNYYMGLTYQTKIPANYAQDQLCRFRTETDTLVAMMPALIPDDVFPPDSDEMSLIAPDSLGDNLAPNYPNLDLSANYYGYSDTRFYSGITNDTGTFPLNSGGLFPTTFFFYVTLIINPENVLFDSVAYAMIHGNIPLFLDEGLYRINGTEFSLDTLVRIGDIESQVINEQLIVACDIQTLTEDEFFGEWPNFSNSLIVEMATAVYTLPDIFLLADFSKFSLQVIDQYVIEPFVNVLPEITDIDFSINNGTSTVWFSYYDQNGHFPLNCDLYVNESIFQMLPIGFDYSQPVIFETTFPFTDWEEATIAVSDNGYEFVEETVVNNTGITYDQLPMTNLQMTNYPNPFNPSTTISFSNEQNQQNEQIEIVIYNIKGQKVKTLPVPESQSHTFSVIWNGDDENSKSVSSGIYFARLRLRPDSSGKSDKTEASCKMLLIK